MLWVALFLCRLQYHLFIFGYSVSIGYTRVATVQHINNIVSREGVFGQQTPGSIYQGVRLKSKMILKPDLVFTFCDLFYRGTLDVLSPDCRSSSCPILRSKTSRLAMSKSSLSAIVKATQTTEINESNINPNRYLRFPVLRFRLTCIMSIIYLQSLHFYLQSKSFKPKNIKVDSLNQLDKL